MCIRDRCARAACGGGACASQTAAWACEVRRAKGNSVCAHTHPAGASEAQGWHRREGRPLSRAATVGATHAAACRACRRQIDAARTPRRRCSGRSTHVAVTVHADISPPRGWRQQRVVVVVVVVEAAPAAEIVEIVEIVSRKPLPAMAAKPHGHVL
eukprot:3633474-Prymnesium_polylepis.2